MIRVASIIICLTFLFQLGVKTGVVIWFEANQSMIAKTLCENRDQPMLHCDGKCVLAQKLEQAETSRKEQTTPILEIQNEIMPCVLNEPTPFSQHSEVVLDFHTVENLYSFLPKISFFHPPPALA